MVRICSIAFAAAITFLASASGTSAQTGPANDNTECGSKSLNFADYRGTLAKTISGRDCQRWDVQSPHKHSRTAEKYPDGGLDENYCRNPDGEGYGWCYTTDPDKRWEPCYIKDCEAPPGNPMCGKKSTLQEEYRGTLSTTHSGKKCQRWDAQEPHTHGYNPYKFADKGLDENYCRNPKPSKKAQRPWCYTEEDSTRWEYCDVPLCEDDPDDTSPPTHTECGSTWSPEGDFLGQKDYRGALATTVSGKTCQRWDQQEPHTHHRTFERYPYEDMVENYCRNPDEEGQGWCYTTDPDTRWEYCQIPQCSPEPPKNPKLCYDYSGLQLDLGPKECTSSRLLKTIISLYKQQAEETGEKCAGGFERDLMGLTRTNSYAEANAVLANMCEAALQEASNAADNVGWEMLENEANIDLNEFFTGDGFLNEETGNFQQEENDFIKRGGYEKFIYIGDDPRKNDYLSTTEESYKAGLEILNTYENEASLSFLTSPTNDFTDSSCPGSNTAVCCWSRDRQYFDNNGNCGQTDCAKQNPGDNTDLCWTEEGDDVFPYPGDTTEQDLHCHGFAWAADESDTNTRAKWNNLFFVSMYDHMYQRGYVDSITDDPLINGTQAMCGCVEDMNPVARADCTEVIGKANYTVFQDGDGGPIVTKVVPGTFHLEFRACQGYDFVEGFTPEDYEANGDKELSNSNNDLSAFVFRLYLEGKMDDQHVENVEKTLIGYRDPSVNDSDDNREAACEAAFKERYPKKLYEEKERT